MSLDPRVDATLLPHGLHLETTLSDSDSDSGLREVLFGRLRAPVTLPAE